MTISTRIGVALDDHSASRICGQQVAQAALDHLDGGPVSLALLFTSHPEPQQVLRGANEVLGDVPLIGATSAGQYTHEGYVERGAGLMLIQSDEIEFHLMAHQRRWFSGRRLLGNLHGISREGLGSTLKHRALMIFPDNQSMNLDTLVERAMTETALLYDILGGASPKADMPPRPPAVFFNNRVLKAGLSGTEVLSQHPLGLALASGWSPVSGPYRVTRADDRRIVTIDGRPAREVYEDFLLERGIEPGDDLPMELTLTYPIGLCPGTDRHTGAGSAGAEAADCKVSVVMGFDGNGALLTSAPPPTGSLIHILATQPDAMITAARRAIQAAHARLESDHNAGTLFIDCVSTGMVLADAYQQQRTAVQEALGATPFLGVRSHGVLARLQGQTAGLYECSVAACVIPG